MNKLATFVLLHLVIIENVQNNKTVETSTTDSDLFRKLNLNLHNMIETLFKNLKVDQNYTTSTKMRLLTLIYDSSRNVSENNFKIYDDITNVSVTKHHNKTNALFNLTTIIDEVFDVFQFQCEPPLDIIVNEFDNTKELFKTLKFVPNATDTEDNMINKMKIFFEKKDSNITLPIIYVNNIKKIKNTEKNYINSTRLKTKKLKRIQRLYRKHKLYHYNLKPWHPPPKSSELVSNATNRRIYKGNQVIDARYSFITSIHVLGEFMCAGSIVSKDLIITAASCLQLVYNDHQTLKKTDAITIRAGSELNRNGGVLASVIEVHFHPMYDPLYLTNNLAIARINSELSFERIKQPMRRIEYDITKSKLPASALVTIFGWGDQNGYTRYTGPLSTARLQVYGLESCKEVYSEDYVQDSNFCAGFVTEGGGACYKDAGGPGVVGSTLVGVISFGPPICGTPDAPTVFTKLGYYTEWIDYVIKKVLKTPKKKSASVMLRQAALVDTTQQPNSQTEHHLDIMILKRLFKYYILSGKMNIKELLPPGNDEIPHLKAKVDYHENSEVENISSDNSLAHENNTIKVFVNSTRNMLRYHPVIEPKTDVYQIDYSKPVTETINAFPDLEMTSRDDGDSKSNSLTDNYEFTNDSHSSNEANEQGLSIEVRSTTENRLVKTTVKPKNSIIYETSSIEFSTKKSLRHRAEIVKTPKSKLKFKQIPNNYIMTLATQANLDTTKNYAKKIKDILYAEQSPPPDVKLQMDLDDASSKDDDSSTDSEPDPNYYDTS